MSNRSTGKLREYEKMLGWDTVINLKYIMIEGDGVFSQKHILIGLFGVELSVGIVAPIIFQFSLNLSFIKTGIDITVGTKVK